VCHTECSGVCEACDETKLCTPCLENNSYCCDSCLEEIEKTEVEEAGEETPQEGLKIDSETIEAIKQDAFAIAPEGVVWMPVITSDSGAIDTNITYDSTSNTIQFSTDGTTPWLERPYTPPVTVNFPPGEHAPVVEEEEEEDDIPF
jgi:hypothetical protein